MAFFRHIGSGKGARRAGAFLFSDLERVPRGDVPGGQRDYRFFSVGDPAAVGSELP